MRTIRSFHSGMAVIFFLVALLVLSGCFPRKPLHMSLLFEEADGVRINQSVMYRGDRIGHVLQLYRTPEGIVTVDVEILPEHRDSVYREMKFRIVEDLSEGYVVLAEDEEGDRTEVEDGEVIDTRPGWTERLSQTARQLSEAAGAALLALGETAGEMLRNLEESPEARSFKDSLAEFARDAAKVARSRYSRFVSDELPQLEKEAAAYRDKLEREGRTEEAEVFWKWFTRWTEAVRNPGQSGDEELKPEEEP